MELRDAGGVTPRLAEGRALTGHPLDNETLAACWSQAAGERGLSVRYGRASLDWLIDRAGRLSSNGRLQRVGDLVEDGAQPSGIIGWHNDFLVTSNYNLFWDIP